MSKPHYSDSSCSGSVPTYLGGARGRRAFYLDEQGALRGITYRAAWRDGENVAQCMVTNQVDPMASTRPFMHLGAVAPYNTGGVVFPEDPDAEPELATGYEWAQCGGLDPECACGFYAYHNSSTAYGVTGPGCRVMAIVEAYGRMVLGTSGYRAQKARILAVCLPPEDEVYRRATALRAEREGLISQITQLQSRNYLPGRSLDRITVATFASALAGAVAGPLARPVFMMVSAFMGVSLIVMRRAMRQELQAVIDSLEDRLEQIDATLHGLPPDYSGHVERAKERYPGVQWFATPKEMNEAFPIESLAELARTTHKEVESDG